MAWKYHLVENATFLIQEQTEASEPENLERPLFLFNLLPLKGEQLS